MIPHLIDQNSAFHNLSVYTKSQISNPKKTECNQSFYHNALVQHYDEYAEVLNVKILRIVSKLCIGIGDTKFDQLMTLFSIDNGFYLGKTQRL
ncbi:hypothetical protein AA650_24660 [Anabaena sp. WA102]|nr:hypothetical protein AA650_24660 [Anabaena sp. WA102]